MYLSSTQKKRSEIFVKLLCPIKEAKEDKILSNPMNGLCNRKHLILNKNTTLERGL
jgi:hypothetical protein